jgi:Skp family chaperone for outer membrane proteins
MNQQRHFETTVSRETPKTKALIADLDRIVQILNDAINVEEKLSGIFDPLQAQYSTHARELTARRDKLADTIAALEHRLSAGIDDRPNKRTSTIVVAEI